MEYTNVTAKIAQKLVKAFRTKEAKRLKAEAQQMLYETILPAIVQTAEEGNSVYSSTVITSFPIRELLYEELTARGFTVMTNQENKFVIIW